MLRVRVYQTGIRVQSFCMRVRGVGNDTAHLEDCETLPQESDVKAYR